MFSPKTKKDFVRDCGNYRWAIFSACLICSHSQWRSASVTERQLNGKVRWNSKLHARIPFALQLTSEFARNFCTNSLVYILLWYVVLNCIHWNQECLNLESKQKEVTRREDSCFPPHAWSRHDLWGASKSCPSWGDAGPSRAGPAQAELWWLCYSWAAIWLLQHILA